MLFSLGYIVGFFLGGGNLYLDKKKYDYKIRFFLNYHRDKEILNFLLLHLRQIGLRSKVNVYRENSKITVSIRNRNLFIFLSFIKDNLKIIEGLRKEFKLGD